MGEKDREIWVGKHRLYLSEDNILYFTGIGEYSDMEGIKIKEAGLKLANMVDGKVDVILDHDKAGKPSSKTRKIFREITEHEKFGKIAHYGVHPVAKVLASFVMGVSKKTEMRFFKTKEEALAWLKEE